MTLASLFDRITIEPEKCGGQPCIRGMRITVRRVLELLATYPGHQEIIREYPFLEEEDLQQSLRYQSVENKLAPLREDLLRADAQVTAGDCSEYETETLSTLFRETEDEAELQLKGTPIDS